MQLHAEKKEKYKKKHRYSKSGFIRSDLRREWQCNERKMQIIVYFSYSFWDFLDLHVETVRFHSLPHCETNHRAQLQLSALLSVPHSFEALNTQL